MVTGPFDLAHHLFALHPVTVVRPNVHHAPNSRGPLQTMMVQRNATSLRRNATEDTAKVGRNQRRHRRHAPRRRLTGGGGVVMAAAPWILQNGIIQAPKK